jgi:predicted RNA binding protein with dsRBD fold (UPF0201 family)
MVVSDNPEATLWKQRLLDETARLRELLRAQRLAMQTARSYLASDLPEIAETVLASTCGDDSRDTNGGL